MDPNATLTELRELAAYNLNDQRLDRPETDRLTELFIALDEWIAKGGFLPSEWVTVPAVAYDIATRMPLPHHDAAAGRFAVSPLDASVFDAHAAFVANELEEEPVR